MIGETIGHYRILAELGSGGMGIVYRAEDLKLGRPVALKFLADVFRDDAVVHDRFLREARAAAALNHPNACTIYEINEGAGRPFIAMELLEGETLQQRLAAGALPVTALLDLAIQVADGLEAAHAKGLIHRDIKPGNIFITRDGRAKVVDFGLAKTVHAVAPRTPQTLIQTAADEQAITRPGTALGTVAYMSPEQARGQETDARSDIFSFGVVVYEMTTGRRAFDGATTAVVFDGILNRMPLPPSFLNPSVPPELEQVIGRAIEKDPSARYQSAAQLASDLRRLRRASDPDIAVEASVPFGAGAASPAWGITPPREVPAGSEATAGRVPAGAGSARRRTLLFFAVGLLAAVASGLGWWFLRAHDVPPGAPVLVTDFVNRTGDADFDGTLKQALIIKLEESPFVTVLPQQKVREALSLMARRPDDAVTPTVGREMCQRVNIGAVMAGEIARLDSTYVLTLSAESCGGDEIGREQIKVSDKASVLNALGTELSSMRRRLGESLASVRSHDKSTIEATTSSLPALKSFSLGDLKRAEGADLESIPYYRAAVDADPQFALAWARLGTVYGNTGEADLSKQCYQKAYDLRDRASEHERFYITSHYVETVLADVAQGRQVLEQWHHEYPHDFMPVHNLGNLYQSTGEPEMALQSFREASALDPRNRLARESTADVLVGLGRFGDARQVLETEIRDLGDSPPPELMLYRLDYLDGNRPAMAGRARALGGTRFDVDFQSIDYDIAVYEGRLRDARAILDEAVAEAQAGGRVGYAAKMRSDDVLNRAIVGLTSDTRADAARILAGHPDDDNTLSLSYALVLAGDTGRARATMAPLWPRLNRAPLTIRVLKPVFDALLALRDRRPSEALEALKPAERWEERFGAGLTAAELRGQAYLGLGNGEAAEAAFHKWIDWPGLDPFSVFRNLAYLNIGRARLLRGDRPGAIKAYDEFFLRWKNADADLPLLVQAKSEYAKLRDNAQ